MRRLLGDRLLLVVSGLCVLFVVCLFFLSLLNRSQRRVGIAAGRLMLAGAYKEYTKSGTLTQGNRVWLSSNAVTIAGTQYQCLLAAQPGYLEGDGILAMTTNHVFIWF